MNTQSKFLLEHQLFEDLKSYLEDKKSALQEALIISVSIPPAGGMPLLEHPRNRVEDLDSTLAVFNEKWAALPIDYLRLFNEETIIERLSSIIQNYVEILEGMCRELFIQLKTIPVDLWDQDLYERLESTKVYLWDKLKEIEHFIKSLDRSLEKFCLKCLGSRSFALFKKLRLRLHCLLDPDLKRQIKRAEIYLHEQFKLFSQGYHFLKKVESRVDTESYKFLSYSSLKELDLPQQRLYGRFYRLIKLLSAGESENQALAGPTLNSLKSICPSGKMTLLFRAYLTLIKNHLFELANKVRMNPNTAAQAEICLYRAELDTLFHAITDYRNFLLALDLKSAKLSWLEKLVLKLRGLPPESRKTKDLLELAWEAQRVDKWLLKLYEAQSKELQEDDSSIKGSFKQINKTLKDMSQPLISQSVMKIKSQELVEELLKVDELVTPLPQVSDLMIEVLLKAFKSDVRHETLTGTKGFWPIWEIHRGLSHSNKSASHLQREKLYKGCTKHILHWLEDHSLSSHHEMAEHEIHDIQQALQEFYHSILPHLSDAETWQFKKDLLEERVFFSRFFAALKKFNHDSKGIREEFSFVDKYLDAIDQKLSEEVSR